MRIKKIYLKEWINMLDFTERNILSADFYNTITFSLEKPFNRNFLSNVFSI